jgi:hypothetical protein
MTGQAVLEPKHNVCAMLTCWDVHVGILGCQAMNEGVEIIVL